MSDPAPSERVYYKHKRSGQVGYLIERDGKTVVKLDRPDPFAVRPWIVEDWEPMTGGRRVPRQLLAQVAWAADRALLRCLGDHRAAKRDWHGLTTEQRIKFMDEGPGELHGPARRKLWEAIREATKDLAE